ncbi:MAG: restriction endonuclease subunit S [Chitinivibrionales bacterium]|nr:restriction endonuclease subunit S [Chitinivibrionales bacterium]
MKNDFAYNPMNLRFGAIARYSGEEVVSLSKYYNIFFCDKTVDSVFCEYYFKSQYMIRFYNKMSTGTLIEKKRVHFSDFLTFNLLFPSLLEQQIIANCLTSLDKLISSQTNKIETLKSHKKSLMQQLFPQVDEVSE